MEAVKVIEKLLIRDCISREKPERYDSCIVCASSMVWRISQLFPESYIVFKYGFSDSSKPCFYLLFSKDVEGSTYSNYRDNSSKP